MLGFFKSLHLFFVESSEEMGLESVLTTKLVGERVSRIITRALDRLEYSVTEEEKRRFFLICLEVLVTITDRIEREERINNKEIKEPVISSVYASAFNRLLAKKIFKNAFEELRIELKNEGVNEPLVLRKYNKYEEVILKSIDDIESLFRVEVIEYLESIPEYKYTSRDINLGGSNSRLLVKNRRAGIEVNVSVPRLRKKFSDLYDKQVNRFSSLISNFSFEVNSIISDSKVDNFTIPADIDEDLLTATFAGGGKKLFQDISELFNISAEFGGYQGSYSGAIEYQSRYYEYLMALTYGRSLPLGVLDDTFGKFDEIYGEKSGEDLGVPGLRFLDVIYNCRSANQSEEETKPVAVKYSKNGIYDRYKDRIFDDKIDFASLTLETLYIKSLMVGDIVKSLLIKQPKKIGHTELHLEILRKIFPSSTDFLGRNTGVTGGIFTFLSGHRRLYALLGNRNTGVYGISSILKTLSSSVESMASTFKELGFQPGGYVPSLELNYHEPDRNKIKKRLENLGFTGPEVEEIVSSKDFSDLLSKAAPISDSLDVISFFRAFDLTKLIYEFGGEKAIREYVDFLYGKDSENSLIRLLGLLNVNRTQDSYIIGSKYSKLIGYLITLTYAIDPERLNTFNQYLVRNNLNLLESISLLIEEGRNSLIKNKSDVSLISGVVAQMVVSDSSGYRDQKPLWDKLVSDSSGRAKIEGEKIYPVLEGITPTELYFLLNDPSATSPIGEMINGVRGGRLTSLLRYSNLFGLLYSLSDFRNSYQLINNQAEDYSKLLELISSLDSFSEYLNLAVTIFENFDDITEKSQANEENLIRVQNKEFSAFTELLSQGGVRDTNKFNILESPGTGNSRTPNGIRIENSLRPEEATLVSSRGGELGVFSRSEPEEGSYVRIAASNLLSAGVIFPSTGTKPESITEVIDVPKPDTGVSYDPVSPGQLGSGILKGRKFDPVESCKRFGGDNCEELGYSTENLCTIGFSKSLYPETGYGREIESPRVPIDRALGEKMTRKIIDEKFTPSSTNYYFSRQGITELSRSQTFKGSEMLCASLSDPFEYSACLSMMKCKRFDPPYKGKYFFSFCPKTFFGGRLAK